MDPATGYSLKEAPILMYYMPLKDLHWFCCVVSRLPHVN